MIEVHHLNNSRSQRVLWLLEELGTPYKIVHHMRDPKTMLGPDSLKDIHPLGKSPVIRDGDIVLPESGAIIEYLTERYGKGRLAPKGSGADRARYLYWLHYAEGSIMNPVLLTFYSVRFGEAMAPVRTRAQGQLALHLDFIEAELGKAKFFMGDQLSAADIQMSFPLEMSASLGEIARYPNIGAFLERIQAMPTYVKALEKGGPYNMAGVMKPAVRQ